MTLFKSILAATDFSDAANNAVHQAAMLAKVHAASLRIVHVVKASGWFDTAANVDRKAALGLNRLRQLAADVVSWYGVRATVEVQTGDVVGALRRAAQNAGLLVIGQRRRDPLAHQMFGRIAQHLVKECHRPILVVKQAAQHRYHRALVPVDFTPAADTAIHAAATLAPQVDLHIFHALDSGGVEAAWRQAGVRTGAGSTYIHARRSGGEVALAARLRRSMARRGLNTLDMRFGFGRGAPGTAALRQADTLGADLMVATRAQEAQPLSAVLGSIDSLLARSHCDMLIVPGGGHVPRHPALPASEQYASGAPGSGSWLHGGASTSAPPSWAGSRVPV